MRCGGRWDRRTGGEKLTQAEQLGLVGHVGDGRNDVYGMFSYTLGATTKIEFQLVLASTYLSSLIQFSNRLNPSARENRPSQQSVFNQLQRTVARETKPHGVWVPCVCTLVWIVAADSTVNRCLTGCELLWYR